ncbi:MAG: hypothetical protein ACLGSH_01820 [Acidobacteriota bacterium]
MGSTRQIIAECVAKLAVGFNLQQTKDEAKMRLEVWAEALKDLPPDLLRKGTTILLQTYQYGMPKPSNLRDVVQGELDDRQQNLMRSKAMLETARLRPSSEPFVREPWNVRVRGLRDSWRKIGNIGKAAGYERQLAEHEARPVEEWARDA